MIMPFEVHCSKGNTPFWQNFVQKVVDKLKRYNFCCANPWVQFMDNYFVQVAQREDKEKI